MTKVVIIIVKAVATIVLVLFGLMFLMFGLNAMKGRGRLLGAFPDRLPLEGALKFVSIWTILTLSAGASMVAAAILLWSRPGLAAVLGLLPALILGWCAATQRKPRRA